MVLAAFVVGVLVGVAIMAGLILWTIRDMDQTDDIAL